MILKEKVAYSGVGERSFYGHKQEQDVAFHLRRGFGHSDQIFVLHNLVIERIGERAQIDHLVIHPFGFIIIESKSIVGEVTVNSAGEWSRSYKGSWSGMPSPIRQAELQKSLLSALLRDNVDKIVAKILGIQTQVGGRDWQVLCAVSSTAIVHRDAMPKAVARKVVKTEFLAEKVKEIVGNTAIGFIKAKPRFSKQELDNIGNFLIEHTAQASLEREATNTSTTDATAVPASVTESVALNYVAAPEPAPTEPASEKPLLSCKHCGESHHLQGMYGQYGYYVKCTSCNTNTSMKQPCPACGWKSVRIAKDGPTYTGSCKKCEHQFLVYRQG